jgi:hypothetical protein
MRVLLRAVAVLFVVIALLLIYFVIKAVASDDDVRVGVAIGYVLGAIVLSGLATYLWRRSAGAVTSGPGGTGAGTSV